MLTNERNACDGNVQKIYCGARLIAFFVSRERGDVADNSIIVIRYFESKVMSEYLA